VSTRDWFSYCMCVAHTHEPNPTNVSPITMSNLLSIFEIQIPHSLLLLSPIEGHGLGLRAAIVPKGPQNSQK